jgi:hypothetical protein
LPWAVITVVISCQLPYGGTGGGINDVDWGSGLRGDYSVYARNFGDLGSDQPRSRRVLTAR